MTNEIKTFAHDGVEYLLGSAGSLILACSKCGEEHFRDSNDYFRHPLNCEQCFACHNDMAPIRMDELETVWKPFWRGLGWAVVG